MKYFITVIFVCISILAFCQKGTFEFRELKDRDGILIEQNHTKVEIRGNDLLINEQYMAAFTDTIKRKEKTSYGWKLQCWGGEVEVYTENQKIIEVKIKSYVGADIRYFNREL